MTDALTARRLAEIDAFYANELNVFTVRVGEFLSMLPQASVRQAAAQIVEESQGTFNKTWLRSQPINFTDLAGQAVFKGIRNSGAQNSLAETMFKRTLVSMHPGERASLRLAEILKCLGRLSETDFKRIVVPIAWNKGETLIEIGGSHGKKLRGQSATLEVLKTLISTAFGDSAAGKEQVQAALRAALDSQSGLSPDHRATLERYLFAGARWMTEAEAAQAAPGKMKSDSALRLGKVAGTATDLLYDLRESLITIAPPGAGKSQAHVLRNLLYLKAPAVVLDVKGEMREGSAAWRAKNIGPVHVFDPKSPGTSLKYNPLDLVSTDPDQTWDDARNLADLLVIPPEQSRSDLYFEGRARDLITTAIVDVVLSEKPERRNMSSVLDRIYQSEEDKLRDWFEDLEEQKIPQLVRAASALKGMPEKQREGILDGARRQLEIWQSPAIDKLSKDTTFSADSLRRDNGTLYLCVSLDDIKKFASVLRVIIGQTVNALCRVAPEADIPPVTFFLDELPRLGRMDVIESALDAGRGYSVRLWMFCQNIGQLMTVYANGEGMVGNCAARCYMNPDEETAQRISRHLGEREGLLDGQRKALAEPPQLTGTDFANQMVVFMRGKPPARLDKQPAFADPTCLKRMNGEEPPEPVSPPLQTETAEPTAASASPPEPVALPQATPRGEGASAPDDQVRASVKEDLPPPATATPGPARFPTWGPWAAPAALCVVLLFAGGALYLKHRGIVAQAQATIANLSQAEAQAAQARAAQRAADVAAAKAATAQREVAQRQAEIDRERTSLASLRRDLEARRKDLDDRVAEVVSARTTVVRRQLAREQAELDSERASLASLRRDLEARRKDLDDREAALSNRSRTAQQQWDAQRRELERQRAAQAARPGAPPVQAFAPPAALQHDQPAATFQRRLSGEAIAAIQTCDRLAANTTDRQRPPGVQGVSFAELKSNAGEALAACQRAHDAAPDNPRLAYQAARAFQAMNRQDDALPLLETAVQLHYAAAYDNLAQIYFRQSDDDRAIATLRAGVRAGDPDSMFHLAMLIESSKTVGRTLDESNRLIFQAAALGHEQAQKEASRRQAASQMFSTFGNVINTLTRH